MSSSGMSFSIRKGSSGRIVVRHRIALYRLEEEPPWGRIVVVQQINVPEDYQKWEILNNLEVIIPVTFHVLGAVYLENASFIPEENG